MAKNNFRAILEVVIVSISEDLNYSIPKEVSISGTAKNPIARTPMHHFSQLFNIKHKRAVCQLYTVYKNTKTIKKRTYL